MSRSNKNQGKSNKGGKSQGYNIEEPSFASDSATKLNQLSQGLKQEMENTDRAMMQSLNEEQMRQAALNMEMIKKQQELEQLQKLQQMQTVAYTTPTLKPTPSSSSISNFGSFQRTQQPFMQQANTPVTIVQEKTPYPALRDTDEFVDSKLKLMAYVMRTGNGDLLDSAQIIREVLEDLAEGNISINGVPVAPMSEITIYTTLVQMLKKIPIEQSKRITKTNDYFPTSLVGARDTVTWKNWELASTILDVIDSVLGKQNKYLSAAALTVALDPIVHEMCLYGLQNPENSRGWMIMSKGPYHFCTFAQIYASCVGRLENALAVVERCFRATNKNGFEDLVVFDPSARPVKTPSKNLLEAKITDTFELQNAFASNPANWRFARDMRLKFEQDGLTDTEKGRNYTIIFGYCEMVVSYGKMRKSPSLRGVKPQADWPPAKTLAAQTAAVLADVQFVIGVLKAPGRRLGGQNRGIKTQDDFFYTEIYGKGGMKKTSDDMWNKFVSEKKLANTV